MDSKLDPINYNQLVQDGNVGETKEVEFRSCKHSNAKIVDGYLRCMCGAAWSGPGLDKLLRLFSGRT